MHIIQMAQEQHAIYFGYAFFRRFRQILQESSRANTTLVDLDRKDCLEEDLSSETSWTKLISHQ